MKKILISLFSLFLFGQLLGQAYIPFPKSNAVWREYSGAPFGDCQEYNYPISGDTIVNGMTFHKLQKTGYVSSYGPSFCNQIKYRYNFYTGAFRNDSINKRVYFLPSGQTNDTILYDFNLKIDDTILFWNAASYQIP